MASTTLSETYDYRNAFQNRTALHASRLRVIVYSLFFFCLALLISIQYPNNSLLGTFVRLYTDIRQINHCQTCCCVDGWDFLLSGSHLIFAFGMLSSMIAQARVECYFKLTVSQYTHINFKLDHLIESTVGWSGIFLFIALLSLVFLSNTQIHIALSYAYVCVLLLIDLLYVSKTADRDPDGEFFLRSPSFALKKFATDLIWKVDLVSVIPLSIWILAAGLLYYFGAEWFDTRTPWEKVAEIFLSGAIGFHLFATWILIEGIMADWNKFLLLSATVYQNTNGKAVDLAGVKPYCIEECLMRVVRTN
jgi:hypothetical protein